MSKLTLEQLAPYLPYRLEVHASTTEIYSSSNIWELEGIVGGNVYMKELTYPADLFNVKPILRPMSDLEKVMYGLDGETKYKYLGDFYTYIHQISPSVTPINLMTYENLLILLEHHFDVFGLIEQGLAIDINTIHVNETTD